MATNPNVDFDQSDRVAVERKFREETERFGALWVVFQVGSRAYDLATIDPPSDYDYRGIFLPSEEYVIGLKKVEQVKVMGDCWVCHDVRQFVRIVINQTPTILEMLFIEDTILPPSWKAFRSELRKLITVDVFKPYSAYLLSQIRKAETRVPIGKRAELVRAVGYDSKFLSHALRLAVQGAGLLRTGKIDVKVPEQYRQQIMAVKQGEVSFEEALTACKEADTDLHKAYKESTLPTKQPLNQFENEVFIPFMRGVLQTVIAAK